MKTIQEALRALKEDQNEVINPSAPTRCETYVYKVKPEQDYLLVGSLVQRIKNEYLNLGFNMSTVYVGFRSMSDTGKAICFLRLSDAREFCNKYNISIDEIYLGRDFNEYVRITKDDDIPAYMQRNGILRCKYQNPQITSNLEAELEDNNSYADTAIIEKNNLRARTKNLYQSGTEKMREISPRLQ